MKKSIHPQYQEVLFVDSTSGHRFVCGSTLQPEGKEKFEGKEYPVSYLSISSSSHPFFTGSKQLVDSEGRVEKFKKRFGKKEAAKDESGEQEAGQEQQHEEAAAKKPAAKKKTAAK
jgi:large subunit ribosomal protein L31